MPRDWFSAGVAKWPWMRCRAGYWPVKKAQRLGEQTEPLT
jgi:hypothetical protein